VKAASGDALSWVRRNPRLRAASCRIQILRRVRAKLPRDADRAWSVENLSVLDERFLAEIEQLYQEGIANDR